MSQSIKIVKNVLIAGAVCVLGYWYFSGSSIKNVRVIPTLYGNFQVTEPVLLELFDHKAMQRIKNVEQYGIWNKVVDKPQYYTRYIHCVGVWALLRKYGAGLEEQIAGLLHDVSHTAFSHVADYKLFGDNALGDSYQDDIHGWYLKQQGIDKVLEKYGISLDSVLHKGGDHSMLEKDLPDICCDRLEYNLEAGILTEMLTKDDIAAMLNDIEYKDGNWFFHSPKMARQFAHVSLYNTEHVWGSPESHLANTWFARMLDYAIKKNVLTFDDMHFSVDNKVWNKLLSCDDSTIKNDMKKLLDTKNAYQLVDKKNADLSFSTKFRGIDPLVKTKDGLKRLTELDKEYKKEYLSVKKRVAAWHVKLCSEHSSLHAA